MREILLYKPERSDEWLFFIVNAICFLTYTSLSVVLTTKLRGVPIERRTKVIMLVYVLTFLCKPICRYFHDSEEYHVADFDSLPELHYQGPPNSGQRDLSAYPLLPVHVHIRHALC